MSEDRSPLQLPNKDWRSRWLYSKPYKVLHRVSKIAWDYDDEKIDGEGVAVCGVKGRMSMPGFVSRMLLSRCKKCCKAVGVPDGKGAPFNDGNLPRKQRVL